MDAYTTDKLVGVTPEDFEQQILKFRDLDDYKMEGYHSPNGQRDLSVKFHWGHNHDFGSFQIAGNMGNRHYKLPEGYDKMVPLHIICEKANVLDIGCWTGGASLFYSAMPNTKHVVAIDEVQKYTDAVGYLKKSFDIKKLEVFCESIYHFGEYQNYFDVVNFSGVLYHLSDPVAGLFNIFGLMAPGGCLLLESEIHPKSEEEIAAYRGPSKKGWNWWFPTANTIKRMLKDVGYEKIKVKSCGTRALAIAYKPESDNESYLMECGRMVI